MSTDEPTDSSQPPQSVRKRRKRRRRRRKPTEASSGIEAALLRLPVKPAHLALIGLFLVLSSIWIFSPGERPDQSLNPAQAFDESDAYWLCKTVIKGTSSAPDEAEVPKVPNVGHGAEFRFVWDQRTGHLRLRNGQGQDTAVSGSCIVNSHQRRITELTVDGKKVH